MLLRVRAAQEKRFREMDAACQRRIVSHRAGPMFWLRELTRTENHHWQEQGLEPFAPFPFEPYGLPVWTRGCTAEHVHSPEACARARLAEMPFEHEFGRGEPCARCQPHGFPFCVPDYFDIAMGFLLTTKLLYIPKTREMMTSWTVVGYLTWECQFYKAIEWMSQSEDDRKAMGLIRYANALYTQQRDWLKARYPLRRGTEGTQHELEWAHASKFTALPSGDRKLASAHPKGYFNDETNHQPAAKATIAVVIPAVKQIVCVSSVAPGWFWEETKTPGK